MTSEPLHAVRPSFSKLIIGLLADFRSLVLLELNLAKHELQVETARMVRAVMWFGIGAGLAVLGVIGLMLMLVHALHAGTNLPLWACYGLVGCALAGVGGGLVAKGATTVGTFRLWPRFTVQSIKANTQWIKNHAASIKT